MAKKKEGAEGAQTEGTQSNETVSSETVAPSTEGQNGEVTKTETAPSEQPATAAPKKKAPAFGVKKGDTISATVDGKEVTGEVVAYPSNAAIVVKIGETKTTVDKIEKTTTTEKTATGKKVMVMGQEGEFEEAYMKKVTIETTVPTEVVENITTTVAKEQINTVNGTSVLVAEATA